MAVNGGVKNWASGEVLDATDLNEFVADQTIARFATIGDRTAAYGVSGAPSLQKGLFSWVESTEKLYFYDGSAWVEVGAQIENDEVTTAKILDGAVTSAKIADGTIVNGDVSASAGIDLSKLATSTAGNIIVYNSSGVPTAVAETGDVTINSSGVTSISSSVIVNADISASAAIAHSKLANATAGQVLLGTTTTGVVTATTISGDVTITGAGVTAIGTGVIVDNDISASAAIAYSKLNLANSITTSDLASGAPRAGFRSTQNAQTGTTYTLALSDLGALVELSNASPITLTVPLESSVAFAVGDRVDIVQTGAGQVTVAGAGGVTVNAYDGQLKLNGQWAAATLIKRATNTWLLIGNITS